MMEDLEQLKAEVERLRPELVLAKERFDLAHQKWDAAQKRLMAALWRRLPDHLQREHLEEDPENRKQIADALAFVAPRH